MRKSRVLDTAFFLFLLGLGFEPLKGSTRSEAKGGEANPTIPANSFILMSNYLRKPILNDKLSSTNWFSWFLPIKIYLEVL